MPVHQISVSPMGGSNINQGTTTNGVKQNRNSNGNTTNAVHSVISCSNNGGGLGYDSQTSSLSSNSYDICRICHCEGDSEVPLIAPCYCAGSLRYVHQVCLQQWIKSSNIRSCELCKFQFIMQTKTKPFSQWEHLEMSGFERRKLVCAVMFHAVALTCVVWSLYVLIDRTAEEIQTGILEWPFWTKLIVVAIGFTGGVVFMYIQCKAYLQICQRWKAFNRVIYVQNAPEKPHLSPSHSTERLRSQSVTALHLLPTPSVSNSEGNRLTIEPSSSEFKPYQDGVRDSVCTGDHSHDRDETSIDLKGVRNLHIFFNDENRIHVQKERSPSCKIDCLDDNEIMNTCNDFNSIVTANNNSGCTSNGQTCPSDNQGSMSWLIKIGKTTSSDRSDTHDRSASDARLPDLNQAHDDNSVSKSGGAVTNLDSPVLKLQIKKAEIVIKFGQKGTSSSCTPTSGSVIVPSLLSSDAPVAVAEDSAKQSSFNVDDNDDPSVNIKFENRESENNEPIVIDLVQNQSNNMSTVKEHHVDNSSVSPSASNPVQIRLDFGCKDIGDTLKPRTNGGGSAEITMVNAVKLLPSSSSSQLLPSEHSAHGGRPSSDKPFSARVLSSSDNCSKSEPGSGSQSPLLATRNEHKQP